MSLSTEFKLCPYKRITLKPRSKTIVQIVTDINTISITHKKNGIYMGKCMVKPRDFTYFTSIINTTEKEVKIMTPHVTLDAVEENNTAEVHAVREKNNRKQTHDYTTTREIMTIAAHRAPKSRRKKKQYKKYAANSAIFFFWKRIN